MSCRETQYQHVSRADSPLFPYQEMRLLPDSGDPRRSVNRRRDFSNGSAANEKHAATLNSTFVSRLIKDLHGKRKIARVCLFVVKMRQFTPTVAYLINMGPLEVSCCSW